MIGLRPRISECLLRPSCQHSANQLTEIANQFSSAQNWRRRTCRIMDRRRRILGSTRTRSPAAPAISGTFVWAARLLTLRHVGQRAAPCNTQSCLERAFASPGPCIHFYPRVRSAHHTPAHNLKVPFAVITAPEIYYLCPCTCFPPRLTSNNMGAGHEATLYSDGYGAAMFLWQRLSYHSDVHDPNGRRHLRR
jgi:hypothetical protein